jgi:hypothetical protein
MKAFTIVLRDWSDLPPSSKAAADIARLERMFAARLPWASSIQVKMTNDVSLVFIVTIKAFVPQQGEKLVRRGVIRGEQFMPDFEQLTTRCQADLDRRCPNAWLFSRLRKAYPEHDIDVEEINDRKLKVTAVLGGKRRAFVVELFGDREAVFEEASRMFEAMRLFVNLADEGVN